MKQNIYSNFQVFANAAFWKGFQQTLKTDKRKLLKQICNKIGEIKNLDKDMSQS